MGKTESKQPTQARSSPTGASVSLDDLAREQGVVPVTDLDELGALWPSEDDPDAFLTFVQTTRAERRVAAEAKARKHA